MDSDSSDDDIDWTLFAYYINHFPRRIIRDRCNPFEMYDDVEFRGRFRLAKETVILLLDIISGHLTYARHRNISVSPLNQLLITLRFYASASFQIIVGDLAGVSQPTVCRIIRKVSHHIALLAQDFITFPTTQGERSTTMNKFFALPQFPGVLGAIDCTHVAICSPGGNDAELYRNRKGYFSINVQAICTASLEVTNIVARWPGSVHDSTIFGNSRICAQFESQEISGGYLLGDAGYGCKNYLLTPLAQTTTVGEQRYNFRHIRTRNPIERLFGVVKRRFPCLQLGLRVKLATSYKVIVACFILHNIARQLGDDDAPDDTALVTGRRIFEDVPAIHSRRVAAPGATAMRTALITETFSRN